MVLRVCESRRDGARFLEARKGNRCCTFGLHCSYGLSSRGQDQVGGWDSSLRWSAVRAARVRSFVVGLRTTGRTSAFRAAFARESAVRSHCVVTGTPVEKIFVILCVASHDSHRRTLPAKGSCVQHALERFVACSRHARGTRAAYRTRFGAPKKRPVVLAAGSTWISSRARSWRGQCT